jgi:hypothetical protein
MGTVTLPRYLLEWYVIRHKEVFAFFVTYRYYGHFVYFPYHYFPYMVLLQFGTWENVSFEHSTVACCAC